MKLAISNIAWAKTEETAVAECLRGMKIKGVEIAPTVVWDSPLTATNSEITDYRHFWQSYGIRIVAMQALLFGREDLTIFDNAEKRNDTREYLFGMMRLANRLGAKILVFGAPKNRRRGERCQAEIEEIAVPLFRELGRRASEIGVSFCIEPNPSAYQCDFVTSSEEGIELVRKVGCKGFRLHLDAAAMTLSGENIETSIGNSFRLLRHFHISEPNLATIGTGGVDHAKCADVLRRLGYKHWISIEMKRQMGGSCVEQIVKAIWASRDYLDQRPC